MLYCPLDPQNNPAMCIGSSPFQEKDMDCYVFKVLEVVKYRDVLFILSLIHFQTAYLMPFREKLSLIF